MSKRIKISSKKDYDGFQIPEKLRNEGSISGGNADNLNGEERGENSWPISESSGGVFGKKYSKLQLQSRCKLYKTIKTALENPRQRRVITSSAFNQIHKGITQDNITNSSFIFSLKEIIKLIFEGAGIPSIFTLGIKDWTNFCNVENNMNQVIIDLQDNNANVIQYYPLRSKKKGDTAFLETFLDFFSELGEKLTKTLEGSSEPDTLKLIVLGWLGTLSKTPLRPLRHSGCVALNGVLRGLSKSRNDMSEKISRFKNQMKGESPDSKSYKSLEEEVSSYFKITKNIDILISKVLNDFWIPRSQDISEDVRNICFETLSKGILVFPSLSEAISNTEVPETLSNFLPEEVIYSNKIFILESIRSILELETFKTISHDLFKNKRLLECLKNEIIISSKAPESHKELFSFGELSISILILALKNDFLDEEYIDEIVDLLWITSSSPSSSKIGALLAEFIDSSLFDGGITHEKVESRELIDLLDSHIGCKKLRNSLGLQGLRTIEPSRIRSDLQTLLEFIHEFGKDYVILTHRCVNAFWSKAPCVRDTKFLVEMLVATELSGQELEPLDEEIRKTLLLVLHSNVSYIEDLLICCIDDPNLNSKNEIVFGKYRSLVAISSIMEYIEPLILIHEKNLDNLTILLSTFSTIVSIYSKLLRTRNNSKSDEITSGISGLKQFPLKKLLQMLNSHSDPRVIDGICMSLSPILNIDLSNMNSSDFNAISSSYFLQMDENHIKGIQDGISDLRKQFMSDFFAVGRNYLADTDNVLYSDMTDEPKGKKSRAIESTNSSSSVKNKAAKNSTINAISKFRRIYGVIKYLTLDNIYLDNKYNTNNSSQDKGVNVDMLSPEQENGIPYSFELLVEVLERSGRIIQKNSDQILVYQTSQLFCIALDILTTGYTHLIQDMLRGIDSNLSNQVNYMMLNESSIEIYKSLRHKFSCTLIETIRFNLKHGSLNEDSRNYCFDYLNILSISSIMVMFGLQGIIENNVQDNEELQSIVDLLEWKILDSDLSMIIKEYIYWTNLNRNNNSGREMESIISSALIESFNSLITSSSNDKKQPHYLLYPNCRIFEPLDNIKDETFVTTPETLETYKKKIKEFVDNKFAPGCILTLLIISCQYELTSQMFTPVIFKYLMDIEEIMVNNYYLDGIKYLIQGESEKDRLFLSSKFLDSFLFNEPNNNIGIFSILFVTIVLSCIEKNYDRTKIISKKLIPSLASKLGWKKTEEIIKENSLDISKSIIESFRFALTGEIHLPTYKNVITRNEIIEKSIKTKDSIKAYIDLLTTQNAPGGGKNVLNLLSNNEINYILDEIKVLCDFGNELNNDDKDNFSSYYFINETFDSEIKQFLDTIASFLEKDQKKNNAVQTNKNNTNIVSSNNTSKVITIKNKNAKTKKNGRKNSLKTLDIYSDNDLEDDIEGGDSEFSGEDYLNDENSGTNIENNNKIDDFKSISSSNHFEEIIDIK